VAPLGEQPARGEQQRVAPVRRRDNDLKVGNDLEIGAGDERPRCHELLQAPHFEPDPPAGQRYQQYQPVQRHGHQLAGKVIGGIGMVLLRLQ
jgi:hypothetical protein